METLKSTQQIYYCPFSLKSFNTFPLNSINLQLNLIVLLLEFNNSFEKFVNRITLWRHNKQTLSCDMFLVENKNKLKKLEENHKHFKIHYLRCKKKS